MQKARGTSRFVYLVGHYAVKRPVLRPWRMFLRGLLANMQERSFGILKSPRLCPIIWACPGGWFVIMRRATPLTDEQFASLNYAEFIKDGQDLPQGEWYLPVENKQSSFGIFGGRIVAVDYGDQD